MTKWFLDMDGVLLDFVSAIHKKFDKEYRYGVPLEWEFFEQWSPPVAFKDFDAVCDIDFWATLPWMHDGREILREVRKRIEPDDEFYLLTTPMPNPGSWTGKALWVEKNLPEWKLIVTNAPKRLLASDDAILIDDKDENIQEFVAAGGRGILVPRLWNELHGWGDESLQVVRNSLEEV